MQYHLNGFRAGDPQVAEASGAGASGDLDVLIVGCGPAGLTLAAYLAQFAGIRTRIVERKDGPLEMGQADGIACRTMEMFEAFGFAHKVAREAYWVNEATFWAPSAEGLARTGLARTGLARTGRVQDVEDGLSEFPHVILSQARVHDFYLEVMQNAPTRLDPDYQTSVQSFDVKDDHVDVTLEGPEGLEVVRTRYLVGCDGARSNVRKELRVALQGDSANAAWGVMDVLCVTDFPDIRFKSVIRSAEEGTILIIPREGGYLVRLYIELERLRPEERVSDKNLGVDHLIAAAQRILRPFSFEAKEVAWWSVYEIGQRVAERFTDAESPRVFIAGDACHTHSPKAGQGMNVSMADAFNLGWKLAAVLQGQSGPQLLQTYEPERRGVAQDLIDFDRDFAKRIAAGGDFASHFKAQGRYTAGVAVRYGPSLIQGDTAHQDCAEGFEIGTRFHSAPVLRLADAKPLHLGHVIRADGRWRVFAFAGAEALPVAALGALQRRLAGKDADLDRVLDVRFVLQVRPESLPDNDVMQPTKGPLGLRDYEKVFAPDPKAGNIFEMRGVDRAQGALVLVRPDQYVAHVLPMGCIARLEAFLGGIFSATSRA